MKKIITGTLIAVLVMILSTGCGKEHDERVQEVTEPRYEPPSQSYFEMLEEQNEGMEFTRNDLNQTDSYEDSGEGEYESFEDEIE